MALPRDLVLPDVLTHVTGRRAAIVVIDGLSVCCFNKTGGDKFWEVAYPHQQHHELRITIWELDGNDNPVGTDPTVDEKVNAGVTRLNISITNGSVAHYSQFPSGGPLTCPFNRKAPGNDQHDLGWLIDLAGPELDHGFQRLLPRRPGRSRVSLARIPNSLFCTLKPEDQPVVISPRCHNNPHHAEGKVIGQNNTELVGVLLAAEDPGVGDIRIESIPSGLLNIRPLPYNRDKRYRIEIINMDDHPAQYVDPYRRGDLHLFYDDVIEVNGEQKELWAIPPKDGRFAPDGDCHPNEYRGPSLEPLLETENSGGGR